MENKIIRKKKVYVWVCPFCCSIWFESYENLDTNDCPYCDKHFEVENK